MLQRKSLSRQLKSERIELKNPNYRRIKWRKWIAHLLLAVLCLILIRPAEVQAADYWPEEPEIASPAVIVMEMSTGLILYEKNSTETYFPASITKIMTTMLALENCELDEIVTFSADAVFKNEGDGSHIARDLGEQMTMEECLYATMLESANECAYAVAEHVAGEGNVEVFAEMMNEKARELGCVNTHFANPSGLPDDEHYTCAYDMALIAQAAYQNETFRIITGTSSHMIPPTNKHEDATPLNNHNMMLHPYKTARYVYEYCTGGKTGYTDSARYTLVEYAEKDGMALVSVVMHTSATERWTDSRILLDYGFDNFQIYSVVENEMTYTSSSNVSAGSLNENSAFVELDPSANIVLPKTVEFSEAQPVVSYNNEVSAVAGTISYTYAGREVGSADIVTTGVVVHGYLFDNQKESETTGGTGFAIQIRAGTIVIIMAVCFLFVALALFLKYLYDNIYIIRHNRMVRKEQMRRFKRIRKRHSRRRRRR